MSRLSDVGAIIAVSLVIGLFVVLAEMIRAWTAGELLTRPRPRRPIVVEWHVVGAVLLMLTLFLLGAIVELVTGGGGQPRGTASSQGVVVSIVVDLIMIGVMVPLLCVTGKNWLTDFGIDFHNWKGEVRFGGLGFLVSIPLVFAVILLMSSVRGPEHEHPYLKLLQRTDSDGAVIAITIAAVIAAPLTEELIFRVVFQGVLESLVPPAVAILIPAVAFSIMHGRYDAIPLFPLALALGIVYHLRRSYVAVVTIHALFNATFLVLALLSHD
jgi:CAAX protease family protein